MKRIFNQESILVENRFIWASLIVVTIAGSLLFRLWFLQIYKGDYYQSVSERNRVRRIEIPARRGIIYDRHGEVLIGNRPFYDLVYIPQYVQDKDTTFKVLSRLLHVPVSSFEKRLRSGRGRPKFLPISLKRNLSQHEVSTIEANKVFLPGIEVRVAPRRDYTPEIPPHMVGYLREIDQETLESLNDKLGDNPYLPGDLVGKQGLESEWESYLRGKRGYRLIQVDAYGRQTQNSDQEWQFPKVSATPGSDLILTIDKELQKSVKEAFNGKFGAVVVLDPRTGEILAQVSEPGFDPEMMQTGLSQEDWRRLTSNPFKPFLDKTTGGEFPPGSIYKPVVAAAALEEKVINTSTTYHCPGFFTLGDRTFHCHNRGGHGLVNLRKALVNSCDVFFYHVGVELGVDQIARYAKAFGLGERLGVNLNTERPGLIPTSAWKQLVHRFPWTKGDTPNISIGQGYNLMTPMQMANLYAALANSGDVWRPFLVRSVTNHIGETVLEKRPEKIKTVDIVSPKTFATMRKILGYVVTDPKGTGKKAAVPGQTVAGKTGSAQVVGLKKNRNQDDVSRKWKEHAIFTAFSPVENAEIAVAVVSQNDKIGGGGRAAAPIAGKIIQRYWELKDIRKARKIALKKQNEADHAKQ
ncbi:penicillin-binding protein 2 [Pseudobacteriovorax antillogorgiicola]|uniref:Peptidoglycan glycosyltransferase n=1 Tax=Pseudobacteriovorax antillogorgiicola TaxID=1513793 RepID=A0A1Y6C1U8_9BACT|nr:penicillin-binding protein 2 [Pseudobacteriovorax antillogorgiicola]TCS50192.1 peptidoglycan glycosyltransferase [Pseudobacteriovorax antillogorgiicola]SMF32165.1 peptidoglycan glycosyltransferase [Pseudobacteriovorax antillogorgiicola]